MANLTPKQAQFVREYLIDLNMTQAAIRAGYSAKTAGQQGEQLLKKLEIAEAVEKAMAKRSEKTEITAEKVLAELWSIANANPNDLIEYRRRCCRFCWGEGFRRQETPGERERRFEAWEFGTMNAKDTEEVRAFDEMGGVGFNATREPNADCPECFGEGVGDAVIKDTRTLSADAARLYAGVKVTKDGFEVKMHDKAAALVNVGRHLGMFTDKHEFTGNVVIQAVPLDDSI